MCVVLRAHVRASARAHTFMPRHLLELHPIHKRAFIYALHRMHFHLFDVVTAGKMRGQLCASTRPCARACIRQAHCEHCEQRGPAIGSVESRIRANRFGTFPGRIATYYGIGHRSRIECSYFQGERARALTIAVVVHRSAGLASCLCLFNLPAIATRHSLGLDERFDMGVMARIRELHRRAAPNKRLQNGIGKIARTLSEGSQKPPRWHGSTKSTTFQPIIAHVPTWAVAAKMKLHVSR